MAKTEEVVIDFPRDLLKTLISPTNFAGKFEDKVVEKEEIELSLGLSLNGRFGVDPTSLKLSHSSSIPDFNSGNGDEEFTVQNRGFSSSSLARACSLPAETAAEWRKRTELQSRRRTEAKRKRSEKQRSLKDGGGDNGGKEDERIAGNVFAGGDKLRRRPPCSQVSGGSPISGSSAVSEAETQIQPLQGKNSSPATDRKHQQKLEIPPETNHKPPENGAKELIRSVMVDMPCVSTKAEGPNARRIEGFLYRYRKSEEVRIVCVCHGRFLSPAEFVKHSGAGEVAHPLKHIVVSPSF